MTTDGCPFFFDETHFFNKIGQDKLKKLVEKKFTLIR